MADDPQQPQFLGGGPKFNRAGAQPPLAEKETTVPLAVPDRRRFWLILLVLVILIVVLYAVTFGPNGMTIKQGRGGVSPNSHTIAPRNIGPP